MKVNEINLDDYTIQSKIAAKVRPHIQALKLSGTLSSGNLATLREMAGCNSEGKSSQGQLKFLDLRNCTIEEDDVFLTITQNTKNVDDEYEEETYEYAIEDSNNIPECAFYGCKILETIYLPTETAKIGQFAFENCEYLKTVFLPFGVEICADAFSGCKNLTELRFYQDKTPIIQENALPSNFYENGKVIIENIKLNFQLQGISDVSLADDLSLEN